MGIYKFGNNAYPWCIRHRSNLGHIFRENSASYGPGNTSLCTLFDLDKHLGSCYCVMILVLLQVEAVNYDENPCIQEFGISVGGKFEEVPARILDAPQLQYSVSKLYTTDS